MSSARRGTVLAICLAAAFTTLLDQSSLNTAAPALRSSLGAGTATVQWIVAGYSLTFGLALVPAGRLGDAYGRKRLFIAGIALFTASAVVAGTAREAWVIAVARLVQGIGAGTINPQVLGLIQELFTGPARARALGAYATVGGVAGAIGPLAGGAMIDLAGATHGWRWVLLLTVPFGLLTIPYALLKLPDHRPPAPARVSVDAAGLALLGAATLAALLPFVLPGDGNPAPWWAGAAVALAALAWWERRYAASGRTPVLLPALVRSPGFTFGTLVAMFQFGASLSASLALTLHLQEGLGWSPLHAAVTVLPSAAGFAVAGALSWRAVGRWGRAGVVWALAGSAAALSGSVAVVAWAPAPVLGPALMVLQLALGTAAGLVVAPNQALTLAHAPAGTAGLAAGLLQVSQRISATVATGTVAGVLLAGTSPAGAGATVRALLICVALYVTSAAFAVAELRAEAVAEPRTERAANRTSP